MTMPLDPRISSSSMSRMLQIVLILIFTPPGVVHADDFHHGDELCPSEAVVDLTNVTENASGFLTDIESGYTFPPWTMKKNTAGVWQGCICDVKPCLPLCPPVDGTKIQVAEDFLNRTAIPRVHNTDLTFDDDEGTRSPEERFHFLIWNPCPGKDAYFLEPEDYPNDEFYLLGNGSLFLPQMHIPEVRFMGLGKYCLRLRPNHSSYTPKVCSPEDQEDNFAVAKYVGSLVAVPFLVATVIVYSVLPELRNLYGKTLICHLCCLIVTFVAFAADRIPPSLSASSIGVCYCLGFTIHFSFLATFFWLNVMCFDMWWTFRGFGPFNGNDAQHNLKKFIRYSIYAWGIPVVLTGISSGLEFFPGNVDPKFLPGFRHNQCWFSTKLAEALYFYGPVSLTIISNIFFFVSTLIKIVRQNRDMARQLSNRDSKSHDLKRQGFNLHLKLFVVMGINWSTEVISWLWEEPKNIWNVTDMVNALLGILIFVIFVCKKNVWHSLKKLYNGKKMQRICNCGCICVSRETASRLTTEVSDK